VTGGASSSASRKGLQRAAALALALCIAAPAIPQAPNTYTLDDLRKVEAQRDTALARLKQLQASQASAERDAASIDADLLAAAADSRRREEAASEAERALVQLDADVKIARANLLNDETSLSDVLAALMTLGARRPPALAASPEDTGDAVRAAILMSEAAPALASRADSIRARIITLNDLMESIRREQAILDEQEAALASRQLEIEALAAEKRLSRGAIDTQTAALTVESRRLAREADTLRDLLDGLAKAAPGAPGRKPQTAAARPPAAAPAPASRPRPTVAANAPLQPVTGQPVRRFGQTVNGEKQPGTTFTVRAGAQVISPRDARVEFSGVFRSYGQMLILDVGDDILVILSGMDALYAEAGQWVLAGEPVGRMASQAAEPPEFYLEVRRKGQPVDPGKWLGQGA
jgi:septal ring factor EnvC (AmiA/AmiB activator)